MSLTEKQKPRVRALVAALRSNEHLQGRTYLTTINVDPDNGDATITRHCCLGVACVEAQRQGLRLDTQVVKVLAGQNKVVYANPEFGRAVDKSSSCLPIVVRNFYGFLGGDPALDIPPQLHDQYRDPIHRYGSMRNTISAICLNDSFNMTFPHIADCFEYTFLRADWDARQVAVPAEGGAQ